ncbi:MAG: coproporphyrinogen-III oxidase family protein [Candidatus Competibacter denitrificans]|jgi:oxygen-independent coproporphyrinogen-3 oxidase
MLSTAVKQELIARARARVEDLERLRQLGVVCREGDFFPSVHYPPITMYQPITDDELLANYTLPPDGRLDIYAHIPFCRQRCVFCHYPLKLGTKQVDEKDHYLDTMEKEMDIYRAKLGVERFVARSVLVGGGTPTYLTLAQQKRFLDMMADRIDMSTCRQYTFDVDPNTLIGEEGRERLQLLRGYGVDRLTIGIQSLEDDILHLMNRHHNAAQAIESIEETHNAGMTVNIEFIFGFPGQTIEGWADMIDRACQLGTEEIQLYRLKIDAYGDYQGPVKQLIKKRPDLLPTIESTLIMKQVAIDILAEYGYTENLRRVFTKEYKHHSRYAHNQCCRLLDQIGFGLTAFSSLRDRFGLNTQSFEEYYSLIESGHLPINRGIIRTPEEQMRWAIVLPLKNRSARKSDFLQATGKPMNGYFRNKINKLQDAGLVVEDDERLVLTKLGAFFADEVAQQFQHPTYMPYPPDHYDSGPLHPANDATP